MPVSIVTPPASYPVTLVEAKAHCRVDGTDEDTLINGLIAAATDHVEKYTGRSILSRTLLWKQDAFAHGISLPRGPVQSVTGVTYVDTNGATQTASASLYELSDDVVYLAPSASWPSTADGKGKVAVTYVAGETAVPAPMKQAILLLIGWWYDNRSAASNSAIKEVPHAVDALLANYRSYGF